MPRPYNANLPESLTASDAAYGAHPGEAYDGQPNKVAPDRGAEGWLPGQRPPAEQFNWYDNRLEKLLRYLDTIDVRNYTRLASPTELGAMVPVDADFYGGQYIVVGTDDAAVRVAVSGNGLSTWTDESAACSAGVDVTNDFHAVVCVKSYAFCFSQAGHWLRDAAGNWIEVPQDVTAGIGVPSHPITYAQNGGNFFKDPDLDYVWGAFRMNPVGNDYITIARMSVLGGYEFAEGPDLGAGDGSAGLTTAANGQNGERAYFAATPGKRWCLLDNDSFAVRVMGFSTDEANGFREWSADPCSGLSSGNVQGLFSIGHELFTVTDNGRLYSSSDGLAWTLETNFSTAAAGSLNVEAFQSVTQHRGCAVARATVRAQVGGDAVGALLVTTDGRTWHHASALPAAILGTIKGRMRSMQDGRLALVSGNLAGSSANLHASLGTVLSVGDDST